MPAAALAAPPRHVARRRWAPPHGGARARGGTRSVRVACAEWTARAGPWGNPGPPCPLLHVAPSPIGPHADSPLPFRPARDRPLAASAIVTGHHRGIVRWLGPAHLSTPNVALAGCAGAVVSPAGSRRPATRKTHTPRQHSAEGCRVPRTPRTRCRPTQRTLRPPSDLLQRTEPARRGAWTLENALNAPFSSSPTDTATGLTPAAGDRLPSVRTDPTPALVGSLASSTIPSPPLLLLLSGATRHSPTERVTATGVRNPVAGSV